MMRAGGGVSWGCDGKCIEDEDETNESDEKVRYFVGGEAWEGVSECLSTG